MHTYKTKKGDSSLRKALQKVTDLVLGILMLPMVGIMSLMAQNDRPAGPGTLKPAAHTTAHLNNQFAFRRAYLTYENKITDNLKFGFRIDADNTANVTGVTLTGSPVTGAATQATPKKPAGISLEDEAMMAQSQIMTAPPEKYSVPSLVKEKFHADERQELLGSIEDYRSGLVPLIVPLTLVKHHVRRHKVEYLAGQIYLDPHPKELMLRNHV